MPEQPAGSRYETLFPLASGGMATVYVGTQRGAFGFHRVVAIKKPHAKLVADPGYRQALIREARLASLIHHANVVDVRDVEALGDDVSLVMDYVEGATLGELVEAQAAQPDGALTTARPARVPAGAAIRVVLDACAGLHAAHEQADERGRPIQLIHRDISPQNLLVGVDGLTRVADFGVAKFKQKLDPTTAVGILKGKLSYMAPEYVLGETIDRRVDVFALGVVLWEVLTGHRLFRGGDDLDTLERVLSHQVPPISTFAPELGTSLDAVVSAALAKAPAERFHTAAAMGAALESSARAANLLVSHGEVSELVMRAFGPKIEERRAIVRARLATEPSVLSVSFEGNAAKTTEPEGPPVSLGTEPEAQPVLLAVRSPSKAPLARTVDEVVARDGRAAPIVFPVISAAPPAAAAHAAPPATLPSATLAVETLRSNTQWPPRGDRESLFSSGGPRRHALGFVFVGVAIAATILVVLRLRASSAEAASAAPSASASASIAAAPPLPPPAPPSASAAPSAPKTAPKLPSRHKAATTAPSSAAPAPPPAPSGDPKAAAPDTGY